MSARLGLQLFDEDGLWCQHDAILFSTERLKFVRGHLVTHAFDYLVPFVRWFVLKLGEVFSIDEVDTVVSTSKKWRQVVLKRFLVRFGESFCELLNENLGFLLVLIDFVFYDFLSLEFLLNLRVKLAVNEDALPTDLVRVDINALATHQILFPFSFI